MIIINFFARLLNKLDYKLFCSKNEEYIPTTGSNFKRILITAVICMIIVAITQISAEEKTEEIVIIAVLSLLTILTMYYIIPNVKRINGTGKRIGYIIFNLILSYAAFVLSMYIVLLLAGYLIFSLFFGFTGIGKGGKDYEITHEDGTKETARSYRGPLGEENLPLRDGRNIDPNNFK